MKSKLSVVLIFMLIAKISIFLPIAAKLILREGCCLCFFPKCPIFLTFLLVPLESQNINKPLLGLSSMILPECLMYSQSKAHFLLLLILLKYWHLQLLFLLQVLSSSLWNITTQKIRNTLKQKRVYRKFLHK